MRWLDALTVNWEQLFSSTVSPFELIVRGSLMIWRFFSIARNLKARRSGFSTLDVLMINMRREFITEEELRAQLRSRG